MDLHMLHGCRLGMSVIFLKTTPEYISENRDAPYYVRGVWKHLQIYIGWFVG